MVPNGKRAELPVFIQFTFQDDLIASERFFFDLSELCAQSDVSTDAVRRKDFWRHGIPGNSWPNEIDGRAKLEAPHSFQQTKA